MNNIFDWATKELSQDAVISCMLNEKDRMSVIFMEDLLNKHVISNNALKYNVHTISNVFSQGRDKSSDEKHISKVTNKIDVFVEFFDDSNKKHSVIIEDKVDTFLHDNQMKKYIDNVIKECSDSAYIHFVLLKTGSYYFWEKDYYREVIQELVNNEMYNNLFFHEYLSTDLYNFTNNNIDNFSFSWIRDYRDYLKKLVCSVNDKEFWATEYRKSVNIFADEIIDFKILKDIDYKYEISKPNGSGKRNHEFKLYGICGEKAKRMECGGSEKDEFYLLPVISFKDDNTVFCFLNINKYSTHKNPEGYIPGKSGQCKELRDYAVAKARAYGYSSPRSNSTLKVCSSNDIYVYNEDGKLDFSELKKEYNKILKLAIEIMKDFCN